MKIGDKVVCVDDSPRKDCNCHVLVRKDSIYVIKGICPITDSYGKAGIYLVGIINFHNCGRSALGGAFAAIRFRKLDELKQESKERTAIHPA